VAAQRHRLRVHRVIMRLVVPQAAPLFPQGSQWMLVMHPFHYAPPGPTGSLEVQIAQFALLDTNAQPWIPRLRNAV
jgi:hypothetical protein